MNEQDIRNLALFFFLILLDEAKALALTAKALKILNSKITPETDTDSKSSLIVSVTKDLYKIDKGKQSPSAIPFSETYFQLPKSLNFVKWKQLLKDTSLELIVPLVWAHVVGYPSKAVALGLGLTSGSVNSRVAKSLKHLGEISAT